MLVTKWKSFTRDQDIEEVLCDAEARREARRFAQLCLRRLIRR